MYQEKKSARLELSCLITMVISTFCLYSCSTVKPEPQNISLPLQKAPQQSKPATEKILIDPRDNSQKLSYWRDAKAGDWVRFMTFDQNLAIFEVVKREGDKITFEARHYKRDGTQTDEEQDIRQCDIAQDDKIIRDVILNNPFLKRLVCKWKSYMGNKVLQCERHYVVSPAGDKFESLFCRQIPCGGYVFQRRGTDLVVLLVDWGDAGNPPKWNHLKPAELLKYWCEKNKFTNEKSIPQKDPFGGEPPEPPEK